jgi:alpha-L-fucosidase
MNNSWGFNINDRHYKSTRDLIRYLVRAAGNNANFLLNVGPMPNGKMQPEFVSRLREMGQWLERNSEAIYGTRGGPIAPRVWGVTTQKAGRVYVHVLDWNAADGLWLPLAAQVKAAKFLKDGSAVDYVQVNDGILIKNIPPRAVDEFDTIIMLELAGK